MRVEVSIKGSTEIKEEEVFSFLGGAHIRSEQNFSTKNKNKPRFGCLNWETFLMNFKIPNTKSLSVIIGEREKIKMKVVPKGVVEEMGGERMLIPNKDNKRWWCEGRSVGL